jgi:hypothetical protein
MRTLKRFLDRMTVASLLPVLAVLVACEATEAGTEPPVDEVAVVSVLPESIAAVVGATVQLNADVRDEAGLVIGDITVDWESANPSIASVDDEGMVSVLAAGTAEIRATARGRSGTGRVRGEAPPPFLQALVLTPSSATLETGATRQFAVSATWSDGSSAAAPVTFTATGGTVGAGGLYTAGGSVGTYRVIARHAGGTRADTAAITIIPVPTVPPPPPGGLANECATPGTGWIWCDDFDVDRLSSYFEYNNPGNSFTRVNGVGNSGSYGMRSRWNAGQVAAGALHLAIGRTPQTYMRPADAGTANHREIYWRVYLRNQAGWVGGGGDKLSRAMVFASSSSWAQAMIAHIWAGDDNTQHENILMIDPARGTDAAGNLLTTGYNDFPNLSWLGIVRGTNQLYAAANVGTWHCIEARARLNDAGQSNGVMQLWIDGQLDASRTGINFLGAYDDYGINAVFLENHWNQGSPAAQERYMDNFVVSTQRIGCGN